MLTLKGRTCVFAGATGNIGRGAVKAMAQGGMHVVMVTHNPAGAADIIEELKDLPGKVTAMSNENGDGAVFGEVEKLFGSVDVVINTTGGLDAPLPLEELDVEKLKGKLSHQVAGPFAMMQQAIPYLKKSKSPRIIFCASAGAMSGRADENMIDSIARAGVLTMTRCFASALAKDGITVNCIARSGMINDHAPHKPSDFDVASVADQIPVGHVGTADEFGALTAYLASEEAGFLTGEIITLAGGLQLYR
ncbi:MAG: SDR family oxidoreductase [Lachnospiraceae bacterium]|nr:SDR family oxidoreductase [Lachnospiraceae bacterium]